ncbi:MAG TPA: hypothetical protein VLJ18_11765 [Thermoanaerobaculia bacterium]|nr:hypothetical protein [Thermoanaerobaculia bacterium]
MKTPIRFSRFAWKEFLRGPLGTPVVLARGIRPVGRLMPVRTASLRLWSRISALPLPAGAKKALYRALWVMPFGPGDPATLPRVVKRHRDFFRSRAAHA